MRGATSSARSLGIHVAKFSIELGPTIFRYQAKAAAPPPPPLGTQAPVPGRGAELAQAQGAQQQGGAGASGEPGAPWVEYSLRLIPWRGYVAFPDDDEKNTQYARDDPDLLQNRPVLDRMIVVSAGVIANLLFA